MVDDREEEEEVDVFCNINEKLAGNATKQAHNASKKKEGTAPTNRQRC